MILSLFIVAPLPLLGLVLSKARLLNGSWCPGMMQCVFREERKLRIMFEKSPFEWLFGNMKL